MEKAAGKGLRIGYIVLAILMLLMMFVSAIGKLTLNPGAVHVINEVVGVPMSFLPVLAACEIAGGLGLVAGIYRPKLGVAGAAGLVLYFLGAIVAHVRVGDWSGVTAPITPLVLSMIALTLAVMRVRRAT
jgi:DoxX-like family